jgi:hypothetical protein
MSCRQPQPTSQLGLMRDPETLGPCISLRFRISRSAAGGLRINVFVDHFNSQFSGARGALFRGQNNEPGKCWTRPGSNRGHEEFSFHDPSCYNDASLGQKFPNRGPAGFASMMRVIIFGRYPAQLN